MSKLHVVATQIGGFAREDAPQMHVVAVLTNEAKAKTLARLAHGQAFEIEVDAVPEGYRQTANALGVAL